MLDSVRFADFFANEFTFFCEKNEYVINRDDVLAMLKRHLNDASFSFVKEAYNRHILRFVDALQIENNNVVDIRIIDKNVLSYVLYYEYFNKQPE
jgi:hypothetical protein